MHMSVRVASHELQAVLEIVVHQSKELQQLAAEALKELPGHRRWSGLLLPCYGLSASVSGSNLSLPVASKQLQRALQGVEQQPLEWQQQAAEALQEVMLGARLRALPLQVLSVIMLRGARSMRQACRAFLDACGPLDCGLRVSESQWGYLRRAPPSLARLTTITALDLRNMLPERLPVSAIQAFPRLRSLALHNVHLTAEHLAAITHLAPSLTALSLPLSRHEDIVRSLPALTALRALTISHPPPIHHDANANGVPPPPPQVHPQSLGAVLGQLPELRYLDVAVHKCEHAWWMNKRRNPTEWLPQLAALSRLTHLTLYGWMAEWDGAVAALLQSSWPSLRSLSVEIERTYESSHQLAAAFAAALAAHTALTSLRLTWLLRSPVALDLSGLAALRSLEVLSWQQQETPLEQLTTQPTLTRLRVQVAPSPTSPPRTLHLARDLVELEIIALPGQLRRTLRHVAQLPRLRLLQLHLQGPARDPKREAAEWARHASLLSALTRLSALRLGAFVPSKFHYQDNLNLPASVVGPVGSLTGLRELRLRGFTSHAVATPQLRPLAALQRLTCLVLFGPVRSDGRGLTVLRQLAQLQRLELGGMPAVPEGRLDAHLLPLPPRLSMLKLRDVEVAAEAKHALHTAAAKQHCDLKVLAFQRQAMQFEVQP